MQYIGCPRCGYWSCRCFETRETPPSSCTVKSLVRWQHEDTGRICEMPKGKNPGRRWYEIKPANSVIDMTSRKGTKPTTDDKR